MQLYLHSPWAADLQDLISDSERSNAASITAFILARLRSDILTAKFKPGAKLPLKTLIARYQVSVVPIREALAVLCGAGLVRLESQRGFRVAPASREDFEDISITRQRLETMAFDLSIRSGDAAWRSEIVKVRARLAQVSQKVGEGGPISEEWEYLHRLFHFTLIARCGSRSLLNFCSQLYDLYDRYRRLTLPSKSFMAGVAADNDDLVHAALHGEAERGRDLLWKHIDAMSQVVLAEFFA